MCIGTICGPFDEVCGGFPSTMLLTFIPAAWPVNKIQNNCVEFRGWGDKTPPVRAAWARQFVSGLRGWGRRLSVKCLLVGHGDLSVLGTYTKAGCCERHLHLSSEEQDRLGLADQ